MNNFFVHPETGEGVPVNMLHVQVFKRSSDHNKNPTIVFNIGSGSNVVTWLFSEEADRNETFERLKKEVSDAF